MPVCFLFSYSLHCHSVTGFRWSQRLHMKIRSARQSLALSGHNLPLNFNLEAVSPWATWDEVYIEGSLRTYSGHKDVFRYGSQHPKLRKRFNWGCLSAVIALCALIVLYHAADSAFTGLARPREIGREQESRSLQVDECFFARLIPLAT